jgi:hypothetical protein
MNKGLILNEGFYCQEELLSTTVQTYISLIRVYERQAGKVSSLKY